MKLHDEILEKIPKSNIEKLINEVNESNVQRDKTNASYYLDGYFDGRAVGLITAIECLGFEFLWDKNYQTVIGIK